GPGLRSEHAAGALSGAVDPLARRLDRPVREGLGQRTNMRPVGRGQRAAVGALDEHRHRVRALDLAERGLRVLDGLRGLRALREVLRRVVGGDLVQVLIADRAQQQRCDGPQRDEALGVVGDEGDDAAEHGALLWTWWQNRWSARTPIGTTLHFYVC